MTKGIAKLYFKGTEIRHEKCNVVAKEPRTITVEQCSDKTVLTFVDVEGRWLLDNHTKASSLLYGSEFIFDQ